MNDNELISIIIECYNHEQYIADCLESLMQQTYKNIEIIICDDCSVDQSFEIITSYEQKMQERFTRVDIRKNNVNQGVTRTLNDNLKRVRGKFIKDCASDDILLPTCIEKNYDYLKQNENKNMVISNGYYVNDEYKLNQQVFSDIIYEELPDFEGKDLFQKLYFSNYISAPCIMFRKEIFEVYGLYDENIVIEDWEYWLRITRIGKIQMGFLNQNLVLYRRGPSSVSSLICHGKLEQKRLYMHPAEMAIVDLYGRYLAKHLYARKKFWVLVQEYRLAVANELRQLRVMVEAELKEFENQQKKDLILKDKIAYQWFKIREYKKA